MSRVQPRPVVRGVPTLLVEEELSVPVSYWDDDF